MPLGTPLKTLTLTLLLSCTSQPEPPPAQQPPQLHTAGLQLPQVPSAIRYACEWPCGDFIEVGLSGILLNGKAVMPLEKGTAKPADLKGFFLPSLYEALEVQRDLLKKLNPDSDLSVLFAMDSRTPWRTAIQVMYTVGQTGTNPLLVVVDSQSAPQAQSAADPASKGLWVGRDENNPLTLARVNAEARPVSMAELGEKARQLLGPDALGCWVAKSPTPSSFGAFASMAGSLIAVSPQKIFLVNAATAPKEVAQPNETATDSKSPLPLKNGALAVIRIDLPEIGEPRNESLPECSPGGIFQSGMPPGGDVFRELDRAPGN
jgi:hypothetical protein